MKPFIHTISLKTNISLEDKNKFQDAFNAHFVWMGNEKKYIMHKYSKKGVLIKLSNRSDEEIKYDKEHRMYKVKIVVNLFKLLNPEKLYGWLTDENDIYSACQVLKSVFQCIEIHSGINLLNNLILSRVDVAKDVVTPSDEYTLEVIRLSKLAAKKCGYRNYIPSGEKLKKKWQIENSSMYYNDYVKAKIYNKKQDLKDHDIDAGIDSKGLLRFEASLKLSELKRQGCFSETFNIDNLSNILYKITCDGDEVLKRYFKDVLIDGSMITKRLQNKYFEMKYDGKNTRIKNMKEYRKAVNDKTEYDFTTDKSYRIKKHFENIGISPVFTQEKFPYIPSFSDMLDGKVNEDVLNYAFIKNKDKSCLFWDKKACCL